VVVGGGEEEEWMRGGAGLGGVGDEMDGPTSFSSREYLRRVLH
jgi:hypothetical protein